MWLEHVLGVNWRNWCLLRQGHESYGSHGSIPRKNKSSFYHDTAAWGCTRAQLPVPNARFLCWREAELSFLPSPHRHCPWPGRVHTSALPKKLLARTKIYTSCFFESTLSPMASLAAVARVLSELLPSLAISALTVVRFLCWGGICQSRERVDVRLLASLEASDPVPRTFSKAELAESLTVKS